ncbi:DUF397 domain-containing protein [Streptomyces alkaliphilus]|uniref:DUF397 domain-containing protein n=1 Tax=Streptomyces alkaliphilus TaxID=1472722 RepID=UPI00117D4F02|nr:DUF397 domain-containing protein [Streptomyces alkaliphilus]MQS08575.1 DUF397 domain-containing protein [Streptomyces alkaliphilus]
MIRSGGADGVWRKSSHSADNGGQCVEMRAVDGTHVAVRDSKDATRGVIRTPREAWDVFLAGVAGDATGF